jgi:hypothetical protein
MEGEDFITREDVVAYVDALVTILRRYAWSPEQSIVFVHKLLDQKLLMEHFFTMDPSNLSFLGFLQEWIDLIMPHVQLFKNAAEKAKKKREALTMECAAAAKMEMERIRRAIREELHHRLSTDETLERFFPGNILFLSLSDNKEKSYQANNAAHASFFLKMYDVFYGIRDEHARASHVQALHKLAGLPKHPNILLPDFFCEQPSLAMGIKRLDLRECDDPTLSLYEGVQAVRDAMRGAAFLARNGLVLEDIHPGNIGSVSDGHGGRKGVLFDLEGLTIEGTPIYGRWSIPGYYPVPQGTLIAISSQEMSYQFGKTLFFLSHKWKKDYPDIWIEMMRLSDLVQKRHVSLALGADRLDAILKTVTT